MATVSGPLAVLPFVLELLHAAMVSTNATASTSALA
jgi:hypothetical protein